jgi:phosphoglycolate phosphatase-like HAD superfamily hydrolase
MYLFDIDGTLLLSGGAGSRVINQVFFERFGVSGVMDTVSPSGKTDEIIFQECARVGSSRDLSDEEFDALLADYIPRMRDELEKSEGFHLMPHVESCLEFLAGSQRFLGIATGNVEAAAMAKLARAGLQERFHFGGYASDSSVRSELVAKAIERGRALLDRPILSEEFVVVGDTVYDIEAAQACGARVVAVATGHVSSERLAEANPDALLSTLEELPDWHSSHFALD